MSEALDRKLETEKAEQTEQKEAKPKEGVPGKMELAKKILLDQESVRDKDFDFRDWIRHQKNRGYDLIEKDRDNFRLETPYGYTAIRFYFENIAELSVIRKKDQELRYYLHFEVLDRAHAIELYREMEEALLSLEKDKKIRVLLCCTSGATTGFLAGRLNEAVEIMNLDYEFDATSVYLLYDRVEEFDIILLAPQIRYLLQKVQNALPNKTVLPLATRDFSSNNVVDTIRYVRMQVQKKQKKNLAAKEAALEKTIKKENCACCVSLEDYIVLQIMILFDYGELKVRMRLRNHGELVLEETSIHRKLTTTRLCDEIRYCLSGMTHCDLISIALPGEVDEGHIFQKGPMHLRSDLAEYLKNAFHTDCFLVNGVNASAYGYSILHPELKNKTISMLSQPFGSPGNGMGNVVNGQLITGKEGIAGETVYYVRRMQHSGPLKVLAKSELGQLEIIISTILPVIALLGPEVLVLRTPMVSDMEEIRNRLLVYLPERAIPELVYTGDVTELTFAGLRALSERYLKRRQKKQDGKS